MLLIENEIVIQHDGCDGDFRPYPDGSMMCYCGAKLSITSDDVFLGFPVLLKDEC